MAEEDKKSAGGWQAGGGQSKVVAQPEEAGQNIEVWEAKGQQKKVETQPNLAGELVGSGEAVVENVKESEKEIEELVEQGLNDSSEVVEEKKPSKEALALYGKCLTQAGTPEGLNMNDFAELRKIYPEAAHKLQMNIISGAQIKITEQEKEAQDTYNQALTQAAIEGGTIAATGGVGYIGIKAIEYGGKKVVVPAIVEMAKVEEEKDLVNFSASEDPAGYLFAKVNKGEKLTDDELNYINSLPPEQKEQMLRGIKGIEKSNIEVKDAREIQKPYLEATKIGGDTAVEVGSMLYNPQTPAGQASKIGKTIAKAEEKLVTQGGKVGKVYDVLNKGFVKGQEKVGKVVEKVLTKKVGGKVGEVYDVVNKKVETSAEELTKPVKNLFKKETPIIESKTGQVVKEVTEDVAKVEQKILKETKEVEEKVENVVDKISQDIFKDTGIKFDKDDVRKLFQKRPEEIKLEIEENIEKLGYMYEDYFQEVFKQDNILKENYLKFLDKTFKNADKIGPWEIMQKGFNIDKKYRVMDISGNRCVVDLMENQIISICPIEEFEQGIFRKFYSIKQEMIDGVPYQIILNEKGQVINKEIVDVIKEKNANKIVEYALSPSKYKIYDQKLANGTIYRIVENRQNNKLIDSFILDDAGKLNFDLFKQASPDNLWKKSESVFAFGQEWRVQKDVLGKIIDIIPDNRISSLAEIGSNFSKREKLYRSLDFLKKHENSIIAYIPEFNSKNVVDRLESTVLKLRQIEQYMPEPLLGKLEKKGLKIIIGDVHADILRDNVAYTKFKKKLFPDRYSGFYYRFEKTAYCNSILSNETRYINNTVMHEIGHAFDFLSDIRIGFSQELKKIHKELYPNLRAYISVDQGLPGSLRGQEELFADSFSDYLVFLKNNANKDLGKQSFICKYNEDLYNYLDKYISPYLEI